MRIALSVLAVSLSACQSVEVQYQVPPPAGDVERIRAQAIDGYQYFVLHKTVLLVAPAAQLGVQAGTASRTPVPAAKAASAPASSAAPSDPGFGLSSARIDDAVWAAVALPTADESRPFTVRGYTNFWKTTSLSLTRYPDSDLVASVNSTSENLFPKRMEQLAAVLGTIAKIGLASVSDAKSPLTPFKLEVPAESMMKFVPLQDGWRYRFAYDIPTPPAGTLSVEEFQTLAVDKKVNYWPVPACRTATLWLQRGGVDYAFYVTVSSAAHVRLEPLPVTGRIDLGRICGASVSGSVTADPVADITANLAAVQQLVKAVSSPASAPAK